MKLSGFVTRPHVAHINRLPGRCIVHSTGNGAGPGPSGDKDKDLSCKVDWEQTAFPTYMQHAAGRSRRCDAWDTMWTEAIRKDDERRRARSPSREARKPRNVLWDRIRSEAEEDAKNEPLLSSFLYASILAHDSFERAMAFVLANRLASATMLATELFELFYEVLTEHDGVSDAAQADVEAVRDRDPACGSYSACLLYYKGFHAIQTHRVGHALWNRGQKVMALALQSRMSEVFAVDIHPAAQIGKGVLLDHGTGTVIGETARIGNYCSLLQGVTLGGTGKETGDRHPKIGCGVLIGAQASILGNIHVGDGAQVAAGSLVLKAVEPHTMVAGNPARVVGRLQGADPALRMDHWIKDLDIQDIINRPADEGKKADPATKVPSPTTAPAAAAPAPVAAAKPIPEPKPAPSPSPSPAAPTPVTPIPARHVPDVEPDFVI